MCDTKFRLQWKNSPGYRIRKEHDNQLSEISKYFGKCLVCSAYKTIISNNGKDLLNIEQAKFYGGQIILAGIELKFTLKMCN